MGSQLTTLTSSDIQRFERDGYVVVRQAFSPVPLRVAELTGEPGDMVFCHPVMVHCRAQNRGVRPRFMRIKQQLLTHQGRRLRSEWQRPNPSAR